MNERRDNEIAAAVRAGKFPPARREHYERLWAGDPEGTSQLLASLAPGLVPVKEVGAAGPPSPASAPAAPSSDPAYNAEHLTTAERARIAAGSAPVDVVTIAND